MLTNRGWSFSYPTHFMLNRPHLEPRHLCFSALCYPLPIMTGGIENHVAISGKRTELHLLEEKTPLLSHQGLKIKFGIFPSFFT